MKEREAFSGRNRRALRLGAVFVAPALVWSLGVRPWEESVGEARSAAAAERTLLQRELELLVAAPLLPAELRLATRSDSASARRLFEGADAYSATAALAGHIADAASAHGVLLRQAEPRDPAARSDGLTQLEVQVQAESDLEALLALLAELELGDRLVEVTHLSIERPAVSVPSEVETLAILATLRGYARMLEAGMAPADAGRMQR